MIWYYILTFFGNMINATLSFLPEVTELPFGMDEILVNAVGYFRQFMSYFPPLQVMFTAFMIYISFRLLLVVLRLFKLYNNPI